LGLFKWVFGCRIKVLGEEVTRADLRLVEPVLGCKFKFWVKVKPGQIWGYLNRFWVKKILRLFWSRVPRPLLNLMLILDETLNMI
jgi:hypothetical protein